MSHQDEEDAIVELPPEFDQEALAEAAQRFHEIVGDSDRVNLTITSEFRDRVRELVEDEDYAANYEQDREHAFTLAKAIDRSDGSIHVVVYSGLFDRARPYGSPLAVLEHEALHVAVSLRGESLNDLRIRKAGAELPVPNDVVAMAGSPPRSIASSGCSPPPGTMTGSPTARALKTPPVGSIARSPGMSRNTRTISTCGASPEES